MLLASAFWYLNALNKRYIHVLTFPINYSGNPSNKIQVAKLPATVDVTIETYGYRIFSYKYGFLTPNIDLNIASSSLFKRSKTDSINYYILTNFERNKITQQFTSDVRIIDIKPDSIYFKFDELSRKKVPIKLRSEFNFAPQHMQIKEAEIQPDSVIIEGPQTVLDTIDMVETAFQQFEQLKQSIKENIPLQKRNGYEITRDFVQLSLQVNQFTESTVEAPIITINVPDSLSLITFPKNCNIYYNVPVELFETIGPEDFRIIVDYNAIDTDSDNLKLQLERTPDNIRISKTTPTRVKFIIEKR